MGRRGPSRRRSTNLRGQNGLFAEGHLNVGRINALSPKSREYPPVVRQPSTRLGCDIGRNSSLPSREMVRMRRQFRKYSDPQTSAALGNCSMRCSASCIHAVVPHPSRSQPLVRVGMSVLNRNKAACGGAREGVNRGGFWGRVFGIEVGERSGAGIMHCLRT